MTAALIVHADINRQQPAEGQCKHAASLSRHSLLLCQLIAFSHHSCIFVAFNVTHKKCLLPARRYASTGYRDHNVSVRLSVRLFVTRRYCVKTKKASVMISSPSGSPKTLVF